MTETTCKIFAEVREINLFPVTPVKATDFKPEAHNNFCREIRVKDSEGSEFVLCLFAPTEEDLYVTFSDSLL